MADGQVLIDSKLNTAGVEKGAKEIKEEFQDLAKVTEKVAKEMEKELDKTGESAESAAVSFKDLFKANLSADLVLDALKQLGQAAIDLGKEAVQVAADINASNAQFEQTFKGIEKTAKDSLNKISKEVGITATRMQNSYTKIFAFTKSVGGDQAQALDISSRALKAAADSAAYYDVSVEEATETLQSFLKGNYENDAALGIAATETTRNAKANELYAKSFAELSEAQKVDVLLAMVEAGNAASGALGQAAREADQWTNVTGELQEAWRLMLGVLGDPLLEGLVPIIKGITNGIKILIETTGSEELSAGMETFRESLAGIDEDFEQTSQTIEKNAALANLYKQRLEELEKDGFEPNSVAAREYSNVVDALNSIYPNLNLQISESTGLLDGNSRAQLANIDAMKKKAVYIAYEEKYKAALKAQADAIVLAHDAEKNLVVAQTERQQVMNQLTETTGKTIEELVNLYTAQYVAQRGFGELDSSVTLLTDDQMSLVEQYLALTRESGRLEEGLKASNAAIAEQEVEIEALQQDMEAAAEEAGVFAEAENNMAEATDGATAAQEDLAKKFQETKDSARESLDSTIGLFQELKFESDATKESIIANWKSQQEAFSNYAQNLQKAVDMGLDEALVQQLSDGTQQSMEYLQILVSDTSTSVEEINAQFQSLSQSKDVAATTIAGIKEGIDVELEGVSDAVTQSLTKGGEGAVGAMSEAATQISVNFTTPVTEEMETLGGVIEETFSNAADTLQENWRDKAKWFESNVETPIRSSTENIGSTMLSTLSSMEKENEEAWNRMVEDVKDAIKDMQQSINSLQGRSINITANRTNSASGSAGLAYYPEGAAYTPSVASAVPVGIPMLASGAVIPPNAPFFAMLGDQTNGRNLEAPEKLIRQIIQEEIGEIVVKNEISFVGELAALARILYPEIQSEARRIGPSLAEEVMT